MAPPNQSSDYLKVLSLAFAFGIHWVLSRRFTSAPSTPTEKGQPASEVEPDTQEAAHCVLQPQGPPEPETQETAYLAVQQQAHTQDPETELKDDQVLNFSGREVRLSGGDVDLFNGANRVKIVNSTFIISSQFTATAPTGGLRCNEIRIQDAIGAEFWITMSVIASLRVFKFI